MAYEKFGMMLKAANSFTAAINPNCSQPILPSTPHPPSYTTLLTRVKRDISRLINAQDGCIK